MIVEAKHLADIAGQLNDLLSSIPKQQERLVAELSLCDRELTDLDHKLELTRFNASEGFKHNRDRQITLVRRREIKNELFILEKTIENISRDSKNSMSSRVNSLSTSLTRLRENTKNLRYNPRVRKDFTDSFHKADIARGVSK